MMCTVTARCMVCLCCAEQCNNGFLCRPADSVIAACQSIKLSCSKVAEEVLHKPIHPFLTSAHKTGRPSSKTWVVCLYEQVVEMTYSEAGGCKLASASIAGRGVYGVLKFESGIHRVQRVPVTESSGRIHTSAASVAVMPQAEEVLCQLL